ncbi:copper resistance D family protein [Paenibacillus sp. CAU 1782]
MGIRLGKGATACRSRFNIFFSARAMSGLGVSGAKIWLLCASLLLVFMAIGGIRAEAATAAGQVYPAVEETYPAEGQAYAAEKQAYLAAGQVYPAAGFKAETESFVVKAAQAHLPTGVSVTEKQVSAYHNGIGSGSWFEASSALTAAAPEVTALLHSHGAGQQGDEKAAFGELAASVALYISRALFYFAMLLAASLPILSLLLPKREDYNPLRKRLENWQHTAAKALLLLTMAYVFLHSISMAGSVGGGENWLLVFMETSSGRVWLAQLILSLLGFLVVSLKPAVKIIWTIGLLAAESSNGHAAASDFNIAASSVDFVHLLCSSIWAGGVMVLLLLWRKDRKEAGRFAERFANIAWMTIALLVASGVAMIPLLAPSWHYVLYTAWGQWLLAKAGLVIVVAATGYGLRRKAKARLMPNATLLKLDGLLMASIVAIASLFTFVGPSASGEPFRHHEMGETFHYTLEIEPNAAGPNTANLVVWLPEGSGPPEQIALSLQASRNSGDKIINVELAAQPTPSSDLEFPGFIAYYYKSEEFVFSRPAKWHAQLVLLNGEGEEIRRSVEVDNN